MVRFTGDSFVLPSTARRGIPIVSVNITSANLKLYRIGDLDRALPDEFAALVLNVLGDVAVELGQELRIGQQRRDGAI
ncbi:hypothetical protein ACC693_39300, partial [Rhizobium ruizarguesonis]